MTCWRVPGSTEHRDLHQRKSALLAGASPDMGSGLCCNPPGNTDVLYVVDVDGRRLVVVARHYPDSPRKTVRSFDDLVWLDHDPPTTGG